MSKSEPYEARMRFVEEDNDLVPYLETPTFIARFADGEVTRMTGAACVWRSTPIDHALGANRRRSRKPTSRALMARGSRPMTLKLSKKRTCHDHRPRRKQ